MIDSSETNRTSHDRPRTPAKSGGKLLDRVHQLARTMHLSIRTERVYAAWIEQFLRFEAERVGKWRHPNEMDGVDVSRFLTYLAVDRKVAASTQNQALAAILFLFSKVLDKNIQLDAVRAKRPARLPVVLSVDEVRRVMNELRHDKIRIMAGLMYGAGLRLLETCRLRVKDIDFDRRQITVRDGKGEKDRMVPLPRAIEDGLRDQTAFDHEDADVRCRAWRAAACIAE